MFKVGIIGPESTGKSTLSRYLSSRYNGLLVSEYARLYLEERARRAGDAYAYTYEDVVRIAEYQVQQLEALLKCSTKGIMCDCLEGVKLNGKNVNDVIFFDTELIITKVWFLHKYGSCPAFVEEAIRKYPMDVYLLCYPDLRWEADPVRENPDIREYLFRWYEKEIQTLGIPYYIVRHD